MSQFYRNGEPAADPTEAERELLAEAEAKGVYLSIETEGQPLAMAAADILDILTLAASKEPEKRIFIKLEMYEVPEND